MKSFKTMIAAAGMALLVTGTAVAENKVVATVNGVEITEKDLELARTEIGEQISSIPENDRRRDLLLYIIENQLLAEAAEKEKLNEGDDADQLMKYYRRRALHDTYYDRKIRDAVTDDEVRKIYDREVAKLTPRTEIRARHILVKTQEDAFEVIELINRGSDFAELAQQKSTGPSGPKGGDLGYFAKGQMVPEFEEAAFKLEKGGVSEPVKTQFGWHVIKIEDKRESKPPSFEEVEEGLKSGLVRQKAIEVIGGLRQAAKIDILDEDVKKAIEEAGKRGSFAQ